MAKTGSACASALLTALTACADLPDVENPTGLPPHPERRIVAELDDGSYRVSLINFKSRAATIQETDVWCWAACAQMVQEFTTGSCETQSEIAARVHGVGQEGEPIVQAATRYEVMSALNPDLEPDPFDQVWTVLEPQLTDALTRVVRSPGSAPAPHLSLDVSSALAVVLEQTLPEDDIDIDDLRLGYPLVIGLRYPGDDVGHICVVYEAVFRPNTIWRRTYDAAKEVLQSLASAFVPRVPLIAFLATDAVADHYRPLPSKFFRSPSSIRSMADRALSPRTIFPRASISSFPPHRPASNFNTGDRPFGFAKDETSLVRIPRTVDLPPGLRQRECSLRAGSSHRSDRRLR